MSNTLLIEFEAKRQKDERFRKENEQWILQYEPLFTHAVTLTFNHPKIRRQMMHIDPSLSLNSTAMIELYKANMRTFKWKLAKSLYGNAYKRFCTPFVWIPILEGLGRDEKPHYHCMLGVSCDRHEVLQDKICSIWNKMPFGSQRVDVKPYESVGWVKYSTKNTLFVNRDSIDWENVLVPQKSTAE